MNNKQSNSSYAWKIVFMCCCLSGAVAGMVVHCKGIFFAPASADIGVSATKFATYATFGSLIGVFTLPLVTRLFNTKPLKLILTVYLVLLCGSDVLMGFATKMWQCYVIGIMQGLVTSFLTVYPIAYLLRNWFTEKRGLVTGISTMFAGLFSSVMNLVLNSLIDAIGWRLTYILLGVSAFLIAEIPVLLFAVRDPSEIGLEPYGGIREQSAVKKEKTRLDRKLLLSTIPIIVVVLAFYIGTGYNQHLPNYARSIGLSSMFGASLISICMAGNTISKPVLGYLNDKLGVFRTSLITIVTMAAAFFTLVFAKPTQVWLLYCSSAFLGQATAFIVVQLPLLLSDRYPVQSEYETCLATVMMVGSFIGAFSNIIINYLFTVSGSYKLGHGISGFMLVISACTIIILAVQSSNHRKKSTE